MGFIESLGCVVIGAFFVSLILAVFELCKLCIADCWHDWDTWVDQNDCTQVRWCKKCNKAELRKP